MLHTGYKVGLVMKMSVKKIFIAILGVICSAAILALLFFPVVTLKINSNTSDSKTFLDILNESLKKDSGDPGASELAFLVLYIFASDSMSAADASKLGENILKVIKIVPWAIIGTAAAGVLFSLLALIMPSNESAKRLSSPFVALTGTVCSLVAMAFGVLGFVIGIKLKGDSTGSGSGSSDTTYIGWSWLLVVMVGHIVLLIIRGVLIKALPGKYFGDNKPNNGSGEVKAMSAEPAPVVSEPAPAPSAPTKEEVVLAELAAFAGKDAVKAEGEEKASTLPLEHEHGKEKSDSSEAFLTEVDETRKTKQLREYKKLLDDGVLTEEEFEAAKKKLLGI